MKTVIKTVNTKSAEFQKLISLRDGLFSATEKAEFAKKDSNSVHAVFMLADEAIGIGSLCIGKESCGEIYGIGVLEKYRRFAIGSDIIGHLKQKGKERGITAFTAVAGFESIDFLKHNRLHRDRLVMSAEGEKKLLFKSNTVFDCAEWVSFNGEHESVLTGFDFEFQGDEEKFTLIYCGLGYCRVFVNGHEAEQGVLSPAWTNYTALDTKNMVYPIFDTLIHRIFYRELNIGKHLKKGKNTVLFLLGGGWFCQRECENEGVKPYGDLMLCFKLTDGGKLVAKSDDDLKYCKSFIKRANVYYGEEQDATFGEYRFANDNITDSFSEKVALAKEPNSVLELQACPSDKVIRQIVPVCIHKEGDYALYDLGENVSGVPLIRFDEACRCGDSCVLTFSEEIHGNKPDYTSTGGTHRVQKDLFITDGVKKEFSPLFTWHGGRYFDLKGNASVTAYYVIHTDIKKTVEFKSSNETLQWIFDAYIRTQLNNIHGCVPSDCPHRERLGYTGDGQITAGAVMTCFDGRALYKKWMRDVADSQDIFTGHVEHTAPFYGGGGGPGGWGCAIVSLPYIYYKNYGEREILREYYPNMLCYLDYMDSRRENGLVVKEEPAGWCLGDWCSPENKNLIPEPFVNTYFYIKSMERVLEVAEILGEKAEKLKEKYAQAKEAFKAKYYDEATGTFCKSTEAADAYGYDLGLGNENTLKALEEKYDELNQFDCGIFGTYLLIKVLCENGKKDLAFKLLTSERENTFYNMKKQGATTLWEMWNGKDSHSHPMFGSVTEFLVKHFNEA